MSHSREKLGLIQVKEHTSNVNNSLIPTPILIIAEVETFRTVYINNMVEVLCDRKAQDFISNESDFYRELIHPEDYPTYISQLNSLEPLQEKEAVIRLKNGNGIWEKYTFKDR